jgi:hypothetical protein
MNRKDPKPDRDQPSLRSSGVEGTKPDEAIRGAAENERLQRDPPPLAHVNPVTGEVLSQPLDKSQEANRNTVPGDGGVKDARPNNGRVTGNPNTDKR